MRALGKHPSKRSWMIQIVPIAFHAIPAIPLENEAIATSGDTWSYWDVNGKRYCHLINPTTKQLASMDDASIASVSVIAKSCLEADAIATALMLFSTPQEAEELVITLKEKHPELRVWIQTRSGGVKIIDDE